MDELQRQRLIDMAWQLNDLVVDLKTPTDLVTLLKSEINDGIQTMSLSRMVLSTLLVNLCKLLEIINHYGKDMRQLPDSVGLELNSIKKTIEDKGIYSYRSTYIAHAFIQEKGQPKRPITLAEATQALIKIIDEGLNPVIENVYSFCNWIYMKEEATCVVNTLHRAIRSIEQTTGGLGSRS